MNEDTFRLICLIGILPIGLCQAFFEIKYDIEMRKAIKEIMSPKDVRSSNKVVDGTEVEREG